MTKADFVRNQLSELAVVDFSNPKQARILCPFHADSNPSLDVSLVRQIKKNNKGVAVGGFNCWSCKEHGPWNKLARKLNLQEWDEKKEEEYEDYPANHFGNLARDLDNMAEAEKEYTPPASDGPWQGPWRGLPGSFLRSVGCESYWDKIAGEYRPLFPISDAFGKRVGHVLARGDGSQIPDKQKYLNSAGFSGSSYWFGLNLEDQPKVLVIVEGPYDMLRFRHLGIPTIANLGVQLRVDQEATVSDEKISQIIAKGCSKVVLAMDADEAGRHATVGFTMSLQKWGIKVFDLNLTRYLKPGQDKMDPGDCPDEVITDLKRFIEGLQ